MGNKTSSLLSSYYTPPMPLSAIKRRTCFAICTKYTLCTRQNKTLGERLWTNYPENSKRPVYMQPNCTTLLFIHGQDGSGNDFKRICSVILENYNYNIIFVDWTEVTNTTDYVTTDFRSIAEEISLFIERALINTFHMDTKKIHLIGIDCGAIISGMTITWLDKKNLKLGKLTALDPYAAILPNIPTTIRPPFNENSAGIVEVINSGLTLDSIPTLGHLNIFDTIGGRQSLDIWLDMFNYDNKLNKDMNKCYVATKVDEKNVTTTNTDEKIPAMTKIKQQYNRSMEMLWTPHEIDIYKDKLVWTKDGLTIEEQILLSKTLILLVLIDDGCIINELRSNKRFHDLLWYYYNLRNQFKDLHYDMYQQYIELYVPEASKIKHMNGIVQTRFYEERVNWTLKCIETVESVQFIAAALIDDIIYACGCYAIFYWFINAYNMPALDKASAFIRRDIEACIDMAVMFLETGIICKPSKEIVADMLRDAVSMTSTFWRDEITLLFGEQQQQQQQQEHRPCYTTLTHLPKYIEYVANNIYFTLYTDVLFVDAENPFETK